MRDPVCDVEDSLNLTIFKFRALADFLMVVRKPDDLQADTLSGIALMVKSELDAMEKRVDELGAIRKNVAV
jgi:hypothetical protein